MKAKEYKAWGTITPVRKQRLTGTSVASFESISFEVPNLLAERIESLTEKFFS